MDSDPDREEAVAAALAWIRDESEWFIALEASRSHRWKVGFSRSKGVAGTDAMSRSRAQERLRTSTIELKSTDDYIAIVEQADLDAAPHFGLPSGAESLRQWIASAREVLHRVVHGRSDGDGLPR